jgi:hypothetical protein
MGSFTQITKVAQSFGILLHMQTLWINFSKKKSIGLHLGDFLDSSCHPVQNRPDLCEPISVWVARFIARLHYIHTYIHVCSRYKK